MSEASAGPTGGYRYGPWDGGPDPLASPFDVAKALDEMGESILDGDSPRDALDRMLRQGAQGRRGLDDLRRMVEKRRREARNRGRLDGTLEEVKELLAKALEAERRELFPDPSDDARMRETELDTLPDDPARAVRGLRDYDWRSQEAREAYQKIDDLLRHEVLDSQFRGLKNALQNADQNDMSAVKDMLADLNRMLEAEARGEDTDQQFREFMDKHGEFFPDAPESLEELVDSLARRAAAAQKMMDSLTPEQREELGNLMAGALGDLGLAAELDRLNSALRSARPDLDWGGRRNRRRGSSQSPMTGDQPLGMGEATSALEELAELDELATALGQDYPGASLDDVDAEAVAEALGRSAVDDLRALQQMERELERQGYLTRKGGKLELTPRAVRRLGASALQRVFAQVEARGRGGHDVRDAGAAGELTGSSREWLFGDEQPLDVVRTVRNGVLRSASSGTALRDATGRVRLEVEDFEVHETERRTTAAVCLLVDLSYSMALRGTWGIAKSTALALHSLISTRYPQDALHIIGFSDYARPLDPTELAGLDSEMVQGTNLQHALMLAGRTLSRYPDAEPVVMVVTDGEPTAHLMRDGSPWFAWPPMPETLELTLAEVDKLTRRRATINVFMLDDEPRLVQFVEEVGRRNGGRVFTSDAEHLGQYVVQDYLRARRGRR